MSGVWYRIEHGTEYVHAGRASTSQHVACLTPRPLPRQRVAWHELSVDPEPADRSTRLDYFGNTVEQFTMLTPYTSLCVTARSVVEIVAPPPPLEPDRSPSWERVREVLDAAAGTTPLDAVECRYPSPYVELGPELAAFARQSFAPGRPTIDAAVDLMHRIHQAFTFDPAATTITTPVARILADQRGVCQDFAHVQIGCLRALGLGARYVSGYLLTDPPPGQPRLVGADASHAWVSVWCPYHGWVDLDPTNDVRPEQRHVTLAWGRDYGDVSPLRGVVLGGGAHTLHVGVSVIPIDPPEA
jgi:transglutaminase-like putative cysteine protease